MTTFHQLGAARVAVHEAGQGEPVLLLHGYSGSHRSYRQQLKDLSRRYLVVAPDWFGWGQSGRDPSVDVSFDAELDRLEELLTRLGPAPWNVVGHDYGGLLALGLTARSPGTVRRLALLNTRAHRTFRPAWYLIFGLSSLLSRSSATAALVRRLPLAWLHRTALRRPIRAGAMGPGEVEEYTAWMSSDPDGPRFWVKYFSQYRVSPRGDLAAALPKISCPTAIIWGAKDEYLSVSIARELAEGIPGAELTLLDGVGHFVTEEAPEEVSRAIERLLERPLGDRP